MNKQNDYLCSLHAIVLCIEQQDNVNYLARPISLWLFAKHASHESLIGLAKKNNIEIKIIKNIKDVHDDIANDLKRYTHILWINQKQVDIISILQSSKTIALVHHITDTQNLAAIIRSAAALKVDALVYPKHEQSSLTPRVRFIAQGATEFLPCIQVTNINNFLIKAKTYGFWIYGFSENADNMLSDTIFSDKSILIIGSEDAGIKHSTLNACDFIVSITMDLGFTCLNAASAASVVFFERYRQIQSNA